MTQRVTRRGGATRQQRPALHAVAGAVLILAASSAAQAQDTQTITVTGIRAAIESAITTKKNAESIVEAISAEDIGKLPDASVAESVARLPGVTAQRNKITGKASSVSVRGMSPDFNGGTLNGREQASSGDSRGVEFDQFPSELLSQVLIYKTPQAQLVGQGLASTIDLRTIRPLDSKKRIIAVGYRDQKTGIDSGVDGEGDGSRTSLSYVDQFADRTLGVALGFTRLKEDGAKIQRFNSWGGWTPTVAYNGEQVTVPGGFGNDTEQTLASRDGAMAVLQYKPNKNFETSLDIFYSKGDFATYKTGLEGPLGGLSTGPNDPGGELINATIVNGIATSGTFTNYKGVVRNHNEAYSDKLNSVGWNTKFGLGGWKLETDLSQSKVKRVSERMETTAGLPGNGTGIYANANDTISFSGFDGSNFDKVVYTTGLNYSDPNIIKLTNVQGWGGGRQDGYLAQPVVTDEINSLRLAARKDLSFGPITGMDLGVHLSERDKVKKTREGVLLIAGSTDPFSYGFADAPGASVEFAGSSGIPVLKWNPRGSIGSVYELSPWTDADILAKNWGVHEKVTTTYARGDLEGQLFGLSYVGNVGLQLVNTNQRSTGQTVDRAACDGALHQCDPIAYSLGTSYTDVLPSLNINADLGGDQVLRVGVARVMARPKLADMRASFEFSYDNTEQEVRGSGGNPYLKPFRANQVDVSYEKYFGNKAYVSVAGFYKDLRSYIVNQGIAVDFAPFLNPSTVLPPGASTIGTITQPVNGSGGRITGIELTASFPFGMVFKPLEGFGISINHSDTSSNIKLPTAGFATNDVGTDNLPLPGLSKQVTNLRFYYERYGFQVSVAQRHRSDFLGEITDYQDNRQLTFVKAESIVDLQLGYEVQSGFAKGLSVLFQAQNLGNAEFKRYRGTPSNVIETVKYGKTYLLGVNYKL